LTLEAVGTGLMMNVFRCLRSRPA